MFPNLFLFTALVLGLLGSLHCVGMCGPIVLALPLNRQNKKSMTAGVALYHAGRLFTYAILGILSGFAGNAVQWATGQQALSIFAGSFILIVLGLGLLGKKIPYPTFISKFLSLIRNNLGLLFKQKKTGTLGLIGMLNGLLPCGLVYAGLAGAAATGNPIKGALFMIAFGIGTIPALAFLSILGNRISIKFRENLRKAVPIFVATMALLLVLRGLGLGIPYISPSYSEDKPTCCCHEK